MKWLTSFRSSWLTKIIAALSLMLVALWRLFRSESAKATAAKQKLEEFEDDYEYAQDLQRRSRTELDQRVREMDGRGFRD